MTEGNNQLQTAKSLGALTKELAIDFFKYKIMEIKDIELSSGKKSPYYMDMRMILSYPEILNKVINLLAVGIKDKHGEGYDKIASVPIGATPFASQLAFNINKPSVLIREQAKSYGNKRLIEGKLAIDDKVILIEDVITTGASVIKTIHKIKNRGAEVAGVWALVNREEGGIENINYEFPDIPVHTIFTTTSIFTPLVKEKIINSYDWERIKFFQESQFKSMIISLRDRNEIKKIPEWESNQAEYFMSHFPYWCALQRKVTSNLILGLEKNKCTEETLKIINLLIKNKVPLPLIYTNLSNKERNLIDLLYKTNGTQIIQSEKIMLGLDHSHFMKNDEFDCLYDPVAFSNQIFISSVADIESAIVNLEHHNQNVRRDINKFIVVEFNKINKAELVNDDVIWESLDKLVKSMTKNNLSLCGIAFKFSDMKLMTKKRLLWKKAPVCLWIDDWYLHPSMLSDTVALDYADSWMQMQYVMERLSPWQIVMDDDVNKSSFPIIDRIAQYSQIFKSDRINKLITQIGEFPGIREFYEMIEKNPPISRPVSEKTDETATNNNNNDKKTTADENDYVVNQSKLSEAEQNRLNTLQTYKMAIWKLYIINKKMPCDNTNSGEETGKVQNQSTQKLQLKRLTTRDVCQNLFNYITRPLIQTFNEFKAQIIINNENNQQKTQKKNE